MNKIVKYGIICFFLLIIGLLLAKTFKEVKLKQERQANIKVLPAVVFYALDGSEVNLREYNSESGTIILFFNMVCGSCQHQINEIIQNSNETKITGATELGNVCSNLRSLSIRTSMLSTEKTWSFMQ